MIELSKIAAIAGQGGLFLIKSPLKNGVMMESLDEKRTRIVAGASSKVSVLSEISIYTQTAEGSVSLESVLKSLNKKYPGVLPVSPKSDGADLKKLLESVLPEVDMERVYVSDIKKLVSWYLILKNQAPEVLEEKSDSEPEKPSKPEKTPKKAKAEKSETEKNEVTEEVEKPKKAASKKKS